MRKKVFIFLVVCVSSLKIASCKTLEQKALEKKLFSGPKDLSQLMDLKVLMDRANLRQSSNETQVSAQPQGPCQCGGGACSCCSRILLNTFRQKACVNVTYDPDEFSFTAKIMMNDQVLYTRSVSGKNPRPICVPVPRIRVIKACVRFYNIYFQGRNVHMCINMEGRYSDTTLFKMGLDCIRLGANGVAIVRPEDGGGIGQVELLPEDPDDNGGGPASDEYDEYADEDEDEDEDDYF